jgi:hypothetical protein
MTLFYHKKRHQSSCGQKIKKYLLSLPFQAKNCILEKRDKKRAPKRRDGTG